MRKLFFILTLFISFAAKSQVNIGSDGRIHSSSSGGTVTITNELTTGTDTTTAKSGLAWVNGTLYIYYGGKWNASSLQSAWDSVRAKQWTTSNFNPLLGYTPLNPANNLADVTNIATARSNLNVWGKQDSSSYATAYQDGLKIPLSQKNANNGVAPLDAGGKVPVANLPSSLMLYKGLWDATTNSPSLANGSGTSGWVYQISNSGGDTAMRNWFGIVDTFYNNDWVMYNGSTWEISGDGNNVKSVSVNGSAAQQGVVSITLPNSSVTNSMLAGSIAASKLVGTDITTVGTLTSGAIGSGFTAIPNSALANSTISGVSLGSNLNALSNGYGVTTLSYNGSSTGSVIVDSTKLLPRADSNIAVGYITPTFLNSKGYGTGSVTSVATGYGLSGGTITTTGTLIADSTALSSKLNVLNQLNKYTGSSNIVTLGTITTGVWQGTAIADSYISSASTWNGKQAAYTNLTSIGSLTNGTGWLYNNGTGTFSYTSPTKTTVGLGNVENTALSTWAGTSNITTVGTLSSGSIPYSLLSGTVPTWNQNTTGTASNITASSNSTLVTASALTTAAGGAFGSNAYTSTAYLPLAAGSGSPLSNDLFITNAGSHIYGGTTTTYSSIGNSNYGSYILINGATNATPNTISIVTASGNAVTFNADHSTTLTGALSGTSATFGGDVQGQYLTLHYGSLNNWYSNATDEVGINYSGYNNGTTQFRNLTVYNGKNTQLFQIIGSTGAATFSSSVTASSFIKSGGTSSQFLMADGSVNTSVLPSGAYLPLAAGSGSPLTGGLYFARDAGNVIASENAALNAYTALNIYASATIINSGLTLTGALSGTSGTFSGNGIFNNGTSSTGGLQIISSLTSSLFTGGIEFLRTSVVAGSKIQPIRDASLGGVGLVFNTTLNNAAEVSGTYTDALTIAPTGAATFSSSVTATSLSLSSTTASTSYTTGTLVVSGGVGIAGAVYANSTMNVAGYLTAAGGAGTSDKRLKDTTVFNFNLSQLDNLHVYQYHWNKQSGLEQERNHYSVFAQEVEKIAPDLVFTANDSMGKKSVNFTELHTLEIERLKQRISEQNDRIERLEKAVFILTHNVHNVAN